MKKLLAVLLAIHPQASLPAEGTIEAQLQKTYEISAQYPVVVDGGRFIFSRYDRTGNTLEAFSLLPFEGTERVLLGGYRDVSFLAEDDSYVALFATGRIRLVGKLDGRSYQSVRLADGARAAYFADNHLYVFQWGFRGTANFQQSARWAVFEVPNLKFVEELHGPIATSVVRVDRKTVLLSNDSIGVYGEGFLEIHKSPVPKLPSGTNSCSTQAPIISNDVAIFVANCGEIYSFSLSDGALTRRLRLDQMFYSLASDGLYLFAIPSTGADRPGNQRGVIVDMATWRVVGSVDATGEAAYAESGRVAAVSFSALNKAAVSVFQYPAR